MTESTPLVAVDATADYVAARSEAVRSIESRAAALAQVQNELAQAVAAHDAGIDNIELSVASTEATVHASTLAVRDAAASQQTSSARIGKVSVGATVGAAFGLLLGPLGAAAGAAAGAFVGNRLHELADPNEEAHTFESSRRWVANGTECFNCHASFSAVRRPHHCRRCGQCFCGQCSQFRIAVPIDGIDFDKPVRVCQDCFIEQARQVRSASPP